MARSRTQKSPFGRLWRVPTRPERRTVVAPDVAGLSQRGQARQANQDRFALRGAVFAVADGVGGNAGGERAAELVVNEAVRLAEPVGQALWRGRSRAAGEPLADIPSRCQALLRAEAGRSPDLAGMATTLTLAVVAWPDAHVVHTGDSRCYLSRAANLTRLTRDQTLAADLVASGALSDTDAARSPFHRVLSSSVTSGTNDVQPASRYVRLQTGDTLLLCTDGLYDVVSDDEIARVLRRAQTAAGACRDLLEAARAAAASDDATAVVVRWT
jgi:PPM family protein phosphatase